MARTRKLDKLIEQTLTDLLANDPTAAIVGQAIKWREIKLREKGDGPGMDALPEVIREAMRRNMDEVNDDPEAEDAATR